MSSKVLPSSNLSNTEQSPMLKHAETHEEGFNSDLENRPAGDDYDEDMVLDMRNTSEQKDSSLSVTKTTPQEPLKSVKFNSNERWSTVNVRVSFDVTRKGERSLVIDGFKFTKSRDGMADRVFWRCSRRECKATAVTVTSKVEHVRAIHEHAPPLASEFFGGTPAVGDLQEVRFNTNPGNSGSGKRRRRRNSNISDLEKSSLTQIKEDLNENEAVTSTPVQNRNSAAHQSWRQNVTSTPLAPPDFNDSTNNMDVKFFETSKRRFASGNEAMLNSFNSSLVHNVDMGQQGNSLSDCLSRSLPSSMLASLTHSRIDSTSLIKNMAHSVASHPLNLESSRRFDNSSQLSAQSIAPLSDPILPSSSTPPVHTNIPFTCQAEQSNSNSQNNLINQSAMPNRQQLEQMALHFLKQAKQNYPIHPNANTTPLPPSISANSPWNGANQWPTTFAGNASSNPASAFSACSPSYAALSPMLSRRRNDSLGSSGEFTPRTSPRSTPLGQDNRSVSSGGAAANSSFLHWKKEKIKESEQEEQHNQHEQIIRQRKRRHQHCSASSPTPSVTMSECDRFWERVSGPLVHKLIEVVEHVGESVCASQPLEEISQRCSIIQQCVSTMEAVKRLKLSESSSDH